MKYSTIRKEYQHHTLDGMVFVDPYATLLSPLVTNVCLRLKLIPNVVTLCMIGSGALGAVFFALPFLWAKILGTVLIHLWYVLDCSDGEVARITKRFSKFGTEIDYTAHVVNHPLFLAAFLNHYFPLGSKPTAGDAVTPPAVTASQTAVTATAIPATPAPTVDPTEKIATFLQGPKSWKERREWSGKWGKDLYDGGSLGGFGCGLCCMAHTIPVFFTSAELIFPIL